MDTVDITRLDALKFFFDSKVAAYNHPAFIKDDPVCIPHLFKKKQDIEIAAFFAAIFCLGQPHHHYSEKQRINAANG
jgi:hypothetical protein